MRTFFAAVIASVATAAISNETEFAFIQYVAKHNKNYVTFEDYNIRFENFKFMDSEIQRLNSMGLTSQHAHNKFSDMSRAEFKAMLSLKDMPKPDISDAPRHDYSDYVRAPKDIQSNSLTYTVNWVTAGKVNAI